MSGAENRLGNSPFYFDSFMFLTIRKIEFVKRSALPLMGDPYSWPLKAIIAPRMAKKPVSAAKIRLIFP